MENTRTETSTDYVENAKTAHIDVIKEDLEPCDVSDFMGDEIGIPYQQTRFMTGRRSEIQRIVKTMTCTCMHIMIMFPGNGKL